MLTTIDLMHLFLEFSKNRERIREVPFLDESFIRFIEELNSQLNVIDETLPIRRT